MGEVGTALSTATPFPDDESCEVRPMPDRCLDRPEALLERDLCFQNLSKNLTGTFHRPEARPGGGTGPDDETLKSRQRVEIRVESHEPCDSPVGTWLDGRLSIEPFVSAFDGRGTGRGVHAGTFRWTGDGVVVEGYLSGITNSGTARRPPLGDGQPCYDPGCLEGRLCGAVVETHHAELDGAYVLGTYRLHAEPTPAGTEGPLRGALEAELLCPCAQG